MRSPAHVVAVPPAERGGNAEQDRDLISLGAAERVPNEMRREVAVLERERLALASCRLLPWLVRGVRTRDGGRVRGMREYRLSGLGAADATEVSTDEGNNFLVVQAVTAYRSRM